MRIFARWTVSGRVRRAHRHMPRVRTQCAMASGRGTACSLSLAALLLVPRPVAVAAAPAPLAAVERALAKVSSFRLITVGQSTEQPPSIERIVTTGVRHGGVLQLDVVTALRPSGAGDTTVDEVVVSGTHVCERGAFNAPLPLKSAFKCRTDPAAATSILHTADPIYALAAPGAVFSPKPVGVKLIANQRCTGYAFRVHTAMLGEHGTLYVAPATNLPYEEDASAVQPPLLGAAGATTQRITLTLVQKWSHFNDPALRIPVTGAR